MTRASLAVFIPLILMVSSRPAMAQQAGREDEVRASVSAFGRAFVEADVSVLETLLAQDYIHVNGRSGSVLSRDEWLKWVESRRTELNSGKLMIDSYSVGDVKVQVYGEAAVVTGVVHSSGHREGALFTSGVRFTNVWVVQGGAWRRAAFHDSPLPESGS
jgi:ketosteroid isomerase-like protein